MKDDEFEKELAEYERLSNELAAVMQEILDSLEDLEIAEIEKQLETLAELGVMETVDISTTESQDKKAT